MAPLRARAAVERFLAAPAPTTESLRTALVACSTLEAACRVSGMADYTELRTQHDSAEARALLDRVLAVYLHGSNPASRAAAAAAEAEAEAGAPSARGSAGSAGGAAARITNQTLLEYFTSEYPPSTAAGTRVLAAFARQSRANVVPEPIAMIPFRRAVYAADFRGALDVMALTCGARSNYRAARDGRLARYAGVWSVGMGAALAGVHSVLQSGAVGAWDAGTSATICAMFGAYLSALTLYGTMALSGSKSALGEVLEWVPGTSPLYRFRHGTQLKMATFATELNRSLPENLGECSPQLLTDLQGLNLRPVETKDEANIKEYWARAGAGFDWVEPDQDPATVLWYEHMERTRQNRLSSAYSRKDGEGRLLSWMNEVEREKQGLSIPHASLLDVGELRSEDGMKTFESELVQDLKEIREGHDPLLSDAPSDAQSDAQSDARALLDSAADTPPDGQPHSQQGADRGVESGANSDADRDTDRDAKSRGADQRGN